MNDSDLPALAKAINMIQYNGYFSCVHCMVEGERIGNTMSFKYSKNTVLRTNDMYKMQVQTARQNRAPFQGIKGQAFLADIIQIPDNILFDYMHSSFIGTVEHVISQWINDKFDETKTVNDWYLGNNSFIYSNNYI